MTPIEEAAVRAVIRQAVRDSMDKGIRCAVEMIRAAAFARPDMTLTQLADAIEATVDPREVAP